MKIKKSVLDAIAGSYPTVPPEEGGILGIYNNVVCAYFHDKGCGNNDFAVYEPNINKLNEILFSWSQKGIAFGGIVHSHLPGQKTLSKADVDYIASVFANDTTLERLYFPIFLPDMREFIPYLAIKVNGKIKILKDTLVVVEDQRTK